ncbi:hypothetical protein ZWY2020_018791 [Hordeum vulgare]|nr:hypothetical protein ZWY2020_018791 [Hordeum vulgare]
METGEVVKATSPADDMKSGGSQDQELQSSPAKVSPEEEEEELFAHSLYYDIWMRLVVAHYIRKLKLDMEKDIWIHGDMYAKASDVDRRMEEFNEIMWVHFDPDLEDPETRAATVERLWRRLEKELDDRADAVVSGAFNYSFESLAPSHQ